MFEKDLANPTKSVRQSKHHSYLRRRPDVESDVEAFPWSSSYALDEVDVSRKNGLFGGLEQRVVIADVLASVVKSVYSVIVIYVVCAVDGVVVLTRNCFAIVIL